LFLYAPILILILFSFNQSKTLGNWTGFTFDWYVQLFHPPEITDALAVTLSVAAISSIVATVLGHDCCDRPSRNERRDRLLLETFRSCRW
jgi:spermidine/putrescine transport system permease protein